MAKIQGWVVDLIMLCLQCLVCFCALSPIRCTGAAAAVEMEYGNSSSTVPMRVGLGALFYSQSSQSPQVLISNNGLFNVLFQQWHDPAGNPNCMAGVAYAWKTPGVMWSFTPQPLLASSCVLNLSSDGVLSLQYKGGVAWQTNTSGSRRPAASLALRDDGNLVLEDIDGLPLWQSFNETSFFFVPAGKHFTKNDTLVERSVIKPTDDFSLPGNFSMRLSHDSARLLLFLPKSMFVYYSLAPANQSRGSVAEYVVVGDSIEFYDSKESLIGSIAANQGVLPQPNTARSAFMHAGDGKLQINYLPNRGGSHIVYYESNLSYCEQPFSCDAGQYKLCNLSASTRCSCPLGFEEDATRNCTPADASYSMVPIPVVFHPQLSASPVSSQDECKVMCEKNATCNAALFDSNIKSCSLFPALFNVVQGTNTSQVMFLKIQPVKHKRGIGPIIGTVIGVSLLLCLACAGIGFVMIRRRRRGKAKHEELFLYELPRLPPRFSYRDLQVATKDFTTKLGAGGFGSVYEGVLASNGVKVAVKKLDQGGAAQSMEQFRAEVATIGSVSHINLVILRGFCMEGVSRLLVYEFMARGSLDRWLFNANKREREFFQVLDWETRCKIALHTARGLEYLHHECTERIVHCDVKPENILLDEKFNAKVADFGLAKLIGADDQSFVMTTLKGTRGYLAPEWLHNTTITTKSDVYSYGVVLLELISGRRCLDPEWGHLPNWALSVACGRPSATSSTSEGPAAIDIRHVEAVLLDERLRGQHVSTDELERMLRIALSCVNIDPEMRPTMEGVVKMLEGVTDVGNISQVHSMTQPFSPGLHGISEAYALLQSTILDVSTKSLNSSSAVSYHQEPLSEVEAR